MQVLGINHYQIDQDNEVALANFRDNAQTTFPIGNGLAESYFPLRRAASGSSPNGVHVIVDTEGTIRYLARNYDEAELTAELDALLVP